MSGPVFAFVRLLGTPMPRHHLRGGFAFFSTWCPAGTGIATLVNVEGRRWAIEDAFETAKTELGLDHIETRSWHGWHRHGCWIGSSPARPRFTPRIGTSLVRS